MYFKQALLFLLLWRDFSSDISSYDDIVFCFDLIHLSDDINKPFKLQIQLPSERYRVFLWCFLDVSRAAHISLLFFCRFGYWIATARFFTSSFFCLGVRCYEVCLAFLWLPFDQDHFFIEFAVLIAMLSNFVGSFLL